MARLTRKRTIEKELNGSSGVTRTLSMESISSLFKRNKKRKHNDEEEFEANEKKLDEELPIDLRKYRPRGFRFNLPPEDRPIRIYADGVFDLFHLGHMKQLEQAKNHFLMLNWFVEFHSILKPINFLQEHKIDYVAHDDLPYASSDSDDIYKPIKEQGKFLTTREQRGFLLPI
ncbi:cytidyltransferase-like domain protein [Candida albicans]|uniref:choline-phosphate cytidylyltransferase n=1 Tax=Candida albicans TaxID=5476 RepID=A0A8H6C2I8_CANAX|nr:cytidyltransferase-like domain protein [Candida albicans]